jgi:signal transduction histidine kinase
MLEKEQILLIIYLISVILFVLTFVVIFFVFFQKRKNKMLIDKVEAERKFEKEIASTKIEIQEQTLKNVAWELHDNIGQLLSVVNMQLNMMKGHTTDTLTASIDETKEIVNTTVQEVRTLSKTLNNEVIQKNGFLRSLEIELERFNRLKYLDAHFSKHGDIPQIPPEVEIILFRILQEFFSNVMRHSRAKRLDVVLTGDAEKLVLSAKDDGIGFDVAMKTESSGLQNMKNRAALLGAQYTLISQTGKGTELKLIYFYPADDN